MPIVPPSKPGSADVIIVYFTDSTIPSSSVWYKEMGALKPKLNQTVDFEVKRTA